MTGEDARRLQHAKRGLAYGLAAVSLITAFGLVSQGNELLFDSGPTAYAIGQIALGFGLFAVFFVCLFFFLHERLPRIEDVRKDVE